MYTYRLWIQGASDPKKVTQLLGVEATSAAESSWTLEVVQAEGDPYYDFINRFLDLLEGKGPALRKLGVESDDISIWMLYEYERQCNMEFDPERMKRLGEAGISLCVSCWEKGTWISF